MTLCKPGTLILIDQMLRYKADITAIQEMKWTGNVVIVKKECMIFYSCDPKKHQYGTGFVVRRKVEHLVIDFELK